MKAAKSISKRRAHYFPALLLVVGVVVGGACTAWVLCPAEVPRPSAPRANEFGPCAECHAQPPVNSTEVTIRDVVTATGRRSLGVCPAEFRGAGRFGSDGTCASDTTFHVSMSLLSGLYRTPGQPPVATCKVGVDTRFEVVVDRNASTTEPVPDNTSGMRATTWSGCNEIRKLQPDLQDVEFEVHQLSRLTRCTASAVDTASGREVEPEHLLGFRRSLTLNVVGAQRGLW